MNDNAIRQLAAAVTLQAVKDFFNASEKKKKIILKDLRSAWMRTLTDGTSANVADELEKNPNEIWERLRQHSAKERAS